LLIVTLGFVGACSDKDGDDTHFLFRAVVTDETRGAAALLMDGAELQRDASGGFVIEREFGDYEAALAASPAALSSRIDSVEVDTLDVRAGFCQEYCGTCAALGNLIYEQVAIAITTDGALQDWNEFGGCRRCKGEVTERAVCP